MTAAVAALRARALWCLPMLLAAAWASASWAGPPAATPVNDAKSWVERIRTASKSTSYQGTLVFTASDVISSSRVGHYCVGDQSFERIEALNGRRQRVYRHNDVIHTFWPDSKAATIERRDALSDTGVSLPDLDPRLNEHYELVVVGNDRIAGRESQVLLLKPRDELRFAQRLWADASTGLMLRADVIGPKGKVLESSAFSDVEIDVRPQRESVSGPMKKLDGYRVVALSPTATSLEAEGWVVRAVPAGFRLVGSVRRSLDDPATHAPPGAANVVQSVYTDGLARVSVFIETDDAARLRRQLMTQIGATHTLMVKRFDRWWVTVMGDVPADTVKQFAAALERRP